MRPAHTIPNVGTLREITMWKAIVLSIVTIGVYYAVLVYQHSKDLQTTKTKDASMWMLWFWLGFITAGLTWIVLYVFNGQAYKEIRAGTGQAESSLWIAALVLAILLPPVGQIIWAVHFNDGLRAAAAGSGSRPMHAPMAQTA